MIVEDGVFHADPHPGNLAVQSDGTLVFYDFGMHGRLGPDTRDKLFEFYLALAEEDIDRVIDVFVALDSLDPEADRELMRKMFSIAIDNFRGREIEQYRIEEIVSEFQGTMRDFPMRLPRNMALVVRVTSVLEGVCRTLDPDFDFITVIKEYVAEQTTDEETLGRFADEFRSRARDLEGSLRRSPPKAEAALDRIDRDALELSMLVEGDDGLLARLGKQVSLGAATGGAVVTTATLYALGDPTGATVAGVAAVGLGLLTKRSFRTPGASRDVRAYTGVAERSLGKRRQGEGDS
jgi:predicted unusual protein kinase regulating ubiquinone biosynthesis (AarF/ABC1/UbiB family)